MPCAEPVRLLALDMDGTLLNTAGHITEASRAAIRAAQGAGVQAVVATGRDYNGILWNELDGIPLDYAVTTNGSSVYRVSDRACLYERCLPCDLAAPLFETLLGMGVYIDVFVDGRDYVPRQLYPLTRRLELPAYVMDSLEHNRTPLDDLAGALRAGTLHIQKGTLNFCRDDDGTLHSREAALRLLAATSGITVADGGFGNLEFTAAGTSKAGGLRFLCDLLGVPLGAVMAVGDSENDAEMLKAAGLGVAMGNAPAPHPRPGRRRDRHQRRRGRRQGRGTIHFAGRTVGRQGGNAAFCR